jgi:aldose 1-epimerase
LITSGQWRAAFRQQDIPVFELQAGAQQLVVTARGGAVLEYSVAGRPIFRPALSDADAQPLSRASFAMVPFVNRIAGGSFIADGRAVQIPPNLSAQKHPLHGQAWLGDWRVAAHTADSVELEFYGGGDTWPWRYRARQIVRLEGRQLLMELRATNLDAVRAPMALGLHPYFPAASQATLQARTACTWEIDAESLPLRRIAVPEAMSFDIPRAVSAMPLDHSFGEWDGRARLCWPDATVELSVEGASWLHVYVPASADFFCLEPQTAAPAALNRGGAELRWLDPGETAVLRARFAVHA